MPSQVGLQGQHRPPLAKYTACFQSKIRVFLPERREPQILAFFPAGCQGLPAPPQPPPQLVLGFP